MGKNYYICNIYIKIIVFFLILIIEKDSHQKEVIDFEDYFSQSICQFLFLPIDNNCSMNFIINDNFYNNILEINININLLINIKISHLENIFLLLSIIPFLKNNSTLFYKINDKEIYNFFKKILNKKIKNKIIKLNYNDLIFFNTKIKELLYYKWDYIPNKFILDNIRYIINNYYNETNSDIFQKTLNINYKSYIQNKINKMTNEEKKNLLSKFFKLILIINQKILEYMKKINVSVLVQQPEYVYYINIIIQVYKSKCLLTNEYYALKEIPKYKLSTPSKIYSHLTEPNILKKIIQYDFLLKIISSFQDYDNIYLITTYYEGISLDFFRNDNLTEEQIKFASACTIQSLSYLREENIIHRDIMMKNIIMDKNKYFNLIDFSFSINYSEKNKKGINLITYYQVTPPEILKYKIFDYNSDYYRLGSVI